MNLRSQFFGKQTRWQTHAFGVQKHLASSLQSWLNETGSLTQRLRTQHNNQFNVSVLLQNWAHGFADETALLNQPQQRYQLIREVTLYASHQPVILAKLQGKKSQYGELGEVIFAYPNLQILTRQFSSTHFYTGQHQNSLQPNELIWGRRTLYGIANHPLLVAEFFLPNCYL